MVKEKRDWIDCCLFLMIAVAEMTDHYLDEVEIATINSKIQQLTSKILVSDIAITNSNIPHKFNSVFEWYSAIGESAQIEQMDEAIKQEILKTANYLKDSKWFNPYYAQILITDLIEIARADGEVIKNEVLAIYAIAQLWGIENPFNQ